MRLQTVAAVAIVAAAGTYLVVARTSPVALPPEAAPTIGLSAARSDNPTIVVHVSGCVASPGIVELGSETRVAAAIAGAGGALRCADLSRVNLAAELRDGEQLVVPSVGSESAPTPTSGNNDDGKVDLNTATAAQLETLPGIGPVLAGRIVDHRESNGLFVEIEDLLDVAGIGEAKLLELRALVDL